MYVSMSILALTGLVGTGVAIGSGVSMMTMSMAEEEAKKTTEDEPADPETMTKEEMAEEIKQLRGYMTTLAETAEDEKHHQPKRRR